MLLKYCFVIEKYKNKIIIGRCLAKSATLFSLVGEICLDGRPVLPSLLVKLKYVNDLLAERERRCSGPGQEQAIFTCSWKGGSLSPYSGEGITVLVFSICPDLASSLWLRLTWSVWTNQFIFVSRQKPNQFGHWLFVLSFTIYFFTHSDIVTNYFLEPSESLIYFLFKLLKSFKVFLKQNINTFYLKD